MTPLGWGEGVTVSTRKNLEHRGAEEGRFQSNLTPYLSRFDSNCGTIDVYIYSIFITKYFFKNCYKINKQRCGFFSSFIIFGIR